jgi:hypothetical protein
VCLDAPAEVRCRQLPVSPKNGVTPVAQCIVMLEGYVYTKLNLPRNSIRSANLAEV